MRKSLEQLIDVSFRVKCLLQIGSYELHQYDDGSYSDFHVTTIKDPKVLNRAIGKLEYRIHQDERGIVIRVFEDYNEY